MDIKITVQGSAPVRLVTCFQDQQPETDNLDQDLSQGIQQLVKDEEFSPKFGETQVITPLGREQPRHIILMGLGKEEEFTPERARKVGGKAVKQAQKLKGPGLDIDFAQFGNQVDRTQLSQALAEGAILATYKFDKFKSERKESTLKEVNLLGQEQKIAPGLEQGKILAEATNLARRLVDEPANILTPAKLSDEAEQAGKDYGFSVKVQDEAGIRALCMEAFWSVGKASDNPPRLIVMEHRGDPDSSEVLGLVGKGLTYDSGGLSLKPSKGMESMKGDMGGAAAVIGAMAAISKLNIKANVVGVIAACENMVSGKSYKPGDIISSMAGKSIEVLNTDAEGRLTLADAVHYAVEKEKATKILDIATLTGSVVASLGSVATGVVGNDDDFYSKLEQASAMTGEKICRFPHDEEYKKLIESSCADIRNTSTGGAGSITAGLFVGAFVQDKPWLHLDIAGTAWTNKEGDYHPKGATGVGVRTMAHLAKLL